MEYKAEGAFTISQLKNFLDNFDTNANRMFHKGLVVDSDDLHYYLVK